MTSLRQISKFYYYFIHFSRYFKMCPWLASLYILFLLDNPKYHLIQQKYYLKVTWQHKHLNRMNNMKDSLNALIPLSSNHLFSHKHGERVEHFTICSERWPLLFKSFTWWGSLIHNDFIVLDVFCLMYTAEKQLWPSSHISSLRNII